MTVVPEFVIDWLRREEWRTTMLKKIALAILAIAVLVQTAAAQDLGPATGAKAPDIGMPLDQSGKPRAIASLMGDKGVVLFFFRSVVW
jgi:hypothetical protein